MATKVKALSTEQTVSVLNSVRTNASAYYQSLIPEIVLEDMADSRSIGALFSAYPTLALELSQGLWGQIAEVYFGNLQNGDPWMALDGPEVRPGDTIQNTYIDIAKPYQYQISDTPWDVFKPEEVDCQTVFHHLNLKDYVKQTIYNHEIEQAFYSWDGLAEYINRVLYNMVESVNYAVYQAKKYMIAHAILEGQMYPIQVPTVTKENASTVTTIIKKNIDDMKFPSRKFNIANVMTSTRPEDLYVIVNTEFASVNDVEVLAQAFNMDKAQFLNVKQLLVDSFGNLDTEWLNSMFGNQPGYEEIKESDLKLLDAVPAVIVARNYLISRPFKRWHDDIRNPQYASINHFEHFWYIMGVSPFANAALATVTTPAVTSVTVTPSNASGVVGQMLKLSATVQTTGFAPTSVVWTSSDATHAPVTADGKVSILTGATGTITITATSTFDSTKYSTCAITIGS